VCVCKVVQKAFNVLVFHVHSSQHSIEADAPASEFWLSTSQSGTGALWYLFGSPLSGTGQAPASSFFQSGTGLTGFRHSGVWKIGLEMLAKSIERLAGLSKELKDGWTWAENGATWLCKKVRSVLRRSQELRDSNLRAKKGLLNVGSSEIASYELRMSCCVGSSSMACYT
jgi:hypothetical protein